MAKKTFGELKGIKLEAKDSNGEVVKVTECQEKGKNYTYKLLYNGDPLFVVNPETLTVRTCIVKYVRIRYYRQTTLTVGYCDKNKNTNYIPTSDDLRFYAGKDKEIELVTLPQSRSKYGLYATTLADALTILNKIKESKTFADLKKGDKIFIASRISNTVESYRIRSIKYSDNSSNKFTSGMVFSLEDNTTIEIGLSKYDTKASIYADSSFTIRIKGHWSDDNRYFVYTTEKEANEDLTSMIKKYEALKKRAKEKSPEGSEIKLKDSKQNTLHIGDKVAYVRNSGQASLLGTGVIIKETKAQIQVFDEDERISVRKQREENKKLYSWSNYKTEYDDDGYHFVTSGRLLLIEAYKK